MKTDNYSWIGGALVAGLVIFAVKDCGKSTDNPTKAMNHFVPTTQARPAVERTLTYWQSYNRIFSELVDNIRGRPDRDLSAHRLAASRCRSLPTLGVDNDLVVWVQDAAEVFSSRADLLERSSDPAALIEAFARIANGEATGVAIDVTRSAQQWWALSRKVLRDDGSRIRALLTARYGIEFPPS